ncbi:MAG TPA: hypothetical protein VJ820_13605 [Propionibacteriaceae bacterium]|nr:hypothetical protein [Propionibacteriaceae bacterium]
MLDIFALFVRCSRIALESAAVVVAPRGKTPLLPSSSMRRRAIPDARSAYAGRRFG